MNKIEDIYKFIEQCKPSFKRSDEGELEMFSVPTQWISGGTAESLLNTGIELYKKRGNQSPLSYILQDESELFGDDSDDWSSESFVAPDWFNSLISACMESAFNKDNNSNE